MFIKLLTEEEVNFCLDKIDQNTFKNGEDTAPNLEYIKVTKNLKVSQTR